MDWTVILHALRHTDLLRSVLWPASLFLSTLSMKTRSKSGTAGEISDAYALADANADPDYDEPDQ